MFVNFVLTRDVACSLEDNLVSEEFQGKYLKSRESVFIISFGTFPLTVSQSYALRDRKAEEKWKLRGESISGTI